MGASTLTAAGLGVGDPGDATADEDGLPGVSTAGRASPDFRPFNDPEHGDLRRPSFTAITRIKPNRSSRVLAWFRGGDPAVVERARPGQGRLVRLGLRPRLGQLAARAALRADDPPGGRLGLWPGRRESRPRRDGRGRAPG
ncbi:MAG: hypothetical protein WKF75_00480 [Singulisphaera sp.]